jgi:hypothetical protein
MTYAPGQLILASDYNGFSGTIPANSAYPNASAATNAVGALIGVGWGDRGYGQTSPLAPVAVGDIITAVQWNNLRDAMVLLNTHTGSALTLQPQVSVGELVLAYDGTDGRPNLPADIVSLDTNRLQADIAEMALTNALTSSVNGWNNTVTHQFTVNFSTEDGARYYFNTGGQIRVSGSVTGASTGLGLAWASLLNAVGVVKFGAASTTYTGTGGVITNNIGYYTATTTYTEIFRHNGSGGYSGALYTIQVRTENVVGANGGNGSLLRFLVTLSDAGVPYGYGTVDGVTSSFVDQYKAAGVLTVASPVFTTTVPL